MHRLLQAVVGTLAALALLVALAMAFVYGRSNARLHRTYAVADDAVAIPTDAGALARGRHLAATRGCFDCHGRDLGGAKVIDDRAMGRLDGPNLTLGRGGRGPGFSDADFVRAIRHGVAADGRGLFLMPSADYSRFTRSDLGDLIAYLKSAPPVDRERVPLRIGPMARILMVMGRIKLAAEVIDHAGLKPDEVTPGVTVAYGRYVSASCTGCHRANFSGGRIDIGPPGWPPAANLTPTGRRRRWSEANFLTALRTGRRPDGTEINPVMPRAFGQMNDVEIKALWAFLQTVPAAATGTR